MSHVVLSIMVIVHVIERHHVLIIRTSLDEHGCLTIQRIIYLSIAE